MLKVMTIVGTRPEIIKLSRVMAELDRYTEHIIVHTGQNYDYELNEIFFQELHIRKPDYFLNVAGKKEAEKQKKEAEKEKKKDTKLVSYEMFCQGMSIDEIAKARELVSGTIAGHLEYYVRLGKIKVEKVVKAENLAKIRKHLEEHEYMGIFAIKAALGDDVSYADIKFVLAVSGH